MESCSTNPASDTSYVSIAEYSLKCGIICSNIYIPNIVHSALLIPYTQTFFASYQFLLFDTSNIYYNAPSCSLYPPPLFLPPFRYPSPPLPLSPSPPLSLPSLLSLLSPSLSPLFTPSCLSYPHLSISSSPNCHPSIPYISKMYILIRVSIK